MFLKEIEIQGFKSFADKTKVVFDKGVTAVVGPNGSGKSNITESLRWALGESSVKSLRGGKMPDVIFAGTESRKPLNYASVTVVLDNQDGFIKDANKEIRVERHIYRSGDSEYRIDGKKVRLRDIHDLFMDTGLGRDSFSIISQGKVEEIFNSKAEDRRAIFEEAAGVLKYKTRRKETESKLSQTQDNLDRLEDIIYELEGQVGPLEKQAKTALVFQDLDQKRQSLHLNVLVAKIQQGRSQLDQVEARIASLEKELKSYYAKREKLEASNQEIKQKRHQLLLEQETAQSQVLDLTRLISDVEGQIQLAHLTSSQAAANQEEIEGRLALLAEKKAALIQKREELNQHLSHIDSQLQQVRSRLKTLEEQLSQFSEDPEQMIENLRENYVRILQEEAESSNSLAALEANIERLIQEESHKAESHSQLEADYLAQREQVAQDQKGLEAIQADLQTLLENYAQKAQELSKLEETYKAAQTAMYDAMDALKGKKARQASLENILANHSNLYAGVKAVMQTSSLSGIIGPVAENLSFDSRYQTALEIALGGASQHIIVRDEDAAKAAIQHLKKNRLGRATFLPLTTIKARSLSDQQLRLLESSPGFLGMAVDLVQVHASYSHIFSNLLGMTAVFSGTEEAQAAARKLSYKVRMVTLDGTELRPGGSYAGGANRNQNTIFIKPELDTLSQEIAADEKSLQEKEAQVAKLKQEKQVIEGLLEDIKTEGDGKRLDEQKAQITLDLAKQRLTELQEQMEIQEMGRDQDGLLQLEEKKESLLLRLDQFAKEKADLELEIEEVKSNRQAIQDRFQKLSQEKADLQLEQSQLLSQKGFDQDGLSRLLDEEKELDQEVAQLETRLSLRLEDQEKIDIPQLESQLAGAKDKKLELDQAMIRYKFELEDLDGQADDLEEQVNHLRSENEERIRQQALEESKKEKLVETLQGLLLTLTEDYQMTIEEAKTKAEDLEDLAASQKELKSLEGQIRSLGPVNLDAIQQFQEVKERLDFLLEQREDVLSAKNLLLETIEEMNSEVRDRFKASFEAIRQSFQVTFRQMFGGGSADLILTDGDLLTAGVEISVQPPGKKIQSLNLMSGGEKALSALALLFSIIRVKTIPFVILDEVEAALDEANVKRFGDYLNRFDKDSQFIVVTHRKGTMAAADSIYGVTMQESGVSKIVSVKLKDLDNLEGAQ